MNSIQSSRYTLIVMTVNFMESAQRVSEFRMAWKLALIENLQRVKVIVPDEFVRFKTAEYSDENIQFPLYSLESPVENRKKN